MKHMTRADAVNYCKSHDLRQIIFNRGKPGTRILVMSVRELNNTSAEDLQALRPLASKSLVRATRKHILRQKYPHAANVP